MPPCGWCSSTREFGNANRLPLVPVASRNAPAEAACPTQ